MHNVNQRGIAVGFFDGVHLGHRKILEGARKALTFRNHPLSLLAPERAPRLIMTFDERMAAIRECGVEEVVALEFTRELSQMSAAEFARRYLDASRIRCGANWRFGRGGEGCAETLRAFGYDVDVAPFVEYKGLRISSTRIREAIEAGDMESARMMLSRAWKMRGRVMPGKGVGRTIGWPTINIEPQDGSLHPVKGVYAVRALGKEGIANFGIAPTMREKSWHRPVLEVHLFEEPGAVPEMLEVEMFDFIREEREFSGAGELQGQIVHDCEVARRVLRKYAKL